MRCFAAGELNDTGKIAIVLAQIWEGVLDANTSVLGGHVWMFGEQRKRLATNGHIVRIIARRSELKMKIMEDHAFVWVRTRVILSPA